MRLATLLLFVTGLSVAAHADEFQLRAISGFIISRIPTSPAPYYQFQRRYNGLAFWPQQASGTVDVNDGMASIQLDSRPYYATQIGTFEGQQATDVVALPDAAFGVWIDDSQANASVAGAFAAGTPTATLPSGQDKFISRVLALDTVVADHLIHSLTGTAQLVVDFDRKMVQQASLSLPSLGATLTTSAPQRIAHNNFSLSLTGSGYQATIGGYFFGDGATYLAATFTAKPVQEWVSKGPLYVIGALGGTSSASQPGVSCSGASCGCSVTDFGMINLLFHRAAIQLVQTNPFGGMLPIPIPSGIKGILIKKLLTTTTHLPWPNLGGWMGGFGMVPWSEGCNEALLSHEADLLDYIIRLYNDAFKTINALRTRASQGRLTANEREHFSNAINSANLARDLAKGLRERYDYAQKHTPDGVNYPPADRINWPQWAY